MDLKPLRTGFIGAGGFARHTLYPALHFAPIALQAIGELDEERAKKRTWKIRHRAVVYGLPSDVGK